MSVRTTWIGRLAGIFGFLMGTVVGFRYLITSTPSNLFFGMGMAAVVMIAAWIFIDWPLLASVMGRRGAKRQAGSWFLVALGLGIAVLINYISYQHSWDKDITEGSVHSLSQETLDVLEGLETPVSITGFYRQADTTGEAYRLRGAIEDLTERYSKHTDQITVELYDPDIEPRLAIERGVFQNGVTFVTCGDREERIITPDENDLTNTLIKVTRSGQKTIYFLSGHGEHDIQDTEMLGYASMTDKLSQSGFAVQALELYREGMVPADATLLVIAGPEMALLPTEIPLIRDFVERRGGGLMVLLEPEVETGLEGLLNSWGITIGNDLVVDLEGQAMVGDFTTVFAEYGAHRITEDLAVPAILYQSRSVTPAAGADGVRPLLLTSRSAWSETDLESLEMSFDAETDSPGPITVAVVAEVARVEGPAPQPPAAADDDSAEDAAVDIGDEPAEEDHAGHDHAELPDLDGDGGDSFATVIVFGDSDLGANATLSLFGNADLILNSVSYLAKEEDLITIRARDEEDRPLQLTGMQQGLVAVIAIPGMTMLVILMGIVMWFTKLAR